MILDLRLCNEGMTCEEHSALHIGGPGRSKMPPVVQERMDEHYDACKYHQSSTWIQSAVGTPVTKEIEEAAQEIIDKYS